MCVQCKRVTAAMWRSEDTFYLVQDWSLVLHCLHKATWPTRFQVLVFRNPYLACPWGPDCVSPQLQPLEVLSAELSKISFRINQTFSFYFLFILHPNHSPPSHPSLPPFRLFQGSDGLNDLKEETCILAHGSKSFCPSWLAGYGRAKHLV